jgi:lysophospholipase L1-like esterase
MKKTDNFPPKQSEVMPRTKNRGLIFGIISLLIPFLFLGIFEGGLRLFGYGHDLGLFVESSERPGFLVMNPHASEKYFGDPENATTGNFEEFSKKKGEGTCRIFVLGESTTIGYPYFYNGSFHRWLQYRLQHSYPNLNFEIINVALTAVNSYTVLGFGREVMKYEPDAVMIYTGHNEYYGAMGVGSTNAIHGNRFLINTLLKLRELRLVQLFNRSWHGLKRLFAGNKKGQREGLMKRMAEGQKIPYDSEIYKQGVRQFETNMDELLALLTKQNIPVFVSNLVSNEKDLPPFISEENGDGSAKNQYQQATLAYEKGDFAKARSLFVKAKELDLLRFRAPEAINETIVKLIQKYPGSHLADTKSLYEKNSPGGIVGKETLLEHVHPNLFGYALLSDAFYQSLIR